MDVIVLILILFVLIFCIGLAAMFFMITKIKKSTDNNSANFQKEISQEMVDNVTAAFGNSIKALTDVANDKLGSVRKETNEDLENKKKLIDVRMADVAKTLDEVQKTLKKYDTDSNTRLTKLSADITNVSNQTKELAEGTTNLNKVLNSSQARGQWGEKMAEDVLQLAGFIEGINYEKQETSNMQTGVGKIRPDFTFKMPDGLRLNMDVKFPLDNYAKYVSAESDDDQDNYQKAFMRDVNNHIGTISNKEYIDPAGGTMDYVLMFIPNEGVYEFIYKNGEDVIDGALQKKIIVCSPLTMFAILSVIRQSMENFAISNTSGEILEILGVFQKEWENFKDHMDKTEKQLGTFTSSFQVLKTTRSNQLDRSINKIQNLRESRGIETLPESMGMIEGN
jgi:DNA recombination protein RmuC